MHDIDKVLFMGIGSQARLDPSADPNANDLQAVADMLSEENSAVCYEVYDTEIPAAQQRFSNWKNKLQLTPKSINSADLIIVPSQVNIEEGVRMWGGGYRERFIRHLEFIKAHKHATTKVFGMANDPRHRFTDWQFDCKGLKIDGWIVPNERAGKYLHDRVLIDWAGHGARHIPGPYSQGKMIGRHRRTNGVLYAGLQATPERARLLRMLTGEVTTHWLGPIGRIVTGLDAVDDGPISLHTIYEASLEYTASLILFTEWHSWPTPRILQALAWGLFPLVYRTPNSEQIIADYLPGIADFCFIDNGQDVKSKLDLFESSQTYRDHVIGNSWGSYLELCNY